MSASDIIGDWLTKQSVSNTEYQSYKAFNSYLYDEFGANQAVSEQGYVQRLLLLQWYQFHRMGYVCTTVNDLIEPSSLLHALYLRLKGEEWTHDFIRQTLEALPIKGDFRPFILEEDRLYMHRYWVYEQYIADWLNQNRHTNSSFLLENELPISFSEYNDWVINNFAELDDAKLKVLFQILNSRFSIVTGGPGTGKTFTLEKILRVYQHWFPNKSIVLAAPTGKAAKRMEQSIASDLIEVYGSPMTIHRMLHAQWDGTFRRTKKNKLSADLIIIDEASMIDIDLFYHVLTALDHRTQLVLLGDHHQLESVEAGNLLGDLYAVSSEAEKDSSPYQVFELSRVYRQNEASHIPELADAIKKGETDLVEQLLLDSSKADLEWIDSKSDLVMHLPLLSSWATNDLEYSLALLKDSDLKDSYKVLSPYKVGPFGGHTINRIMDQSASKQKAPIRTSAWYLGRPVIVQVNDPNTNLFNGDMGVCSSITPDMIAKLDGEKEEILVSRLPRYDLAFALTIHKSQGSEFDHVLVVLNPEDSRLHTRELLYTAITRAKKSVTLLATLEQIKKAVSTSTSRRTGLMKKISS